MKFLMNLDADDWKVKLKPEICMQKYGVFQKMFCTQISNQNRL